MKKIIFLLGIIIITMTLVSCDEKTQNYYENEELSIYTTEIYDCSRIPALNALNFEKYEAIVSYKSCKKTRKDNIEDKMMLDWFGNNIELQYKCKTNTKVGTTYIYEIKNEYQKYFYFTRIDNSLKLIKYYGGQEFLKVEELWNENLSLEENTFEIAKQILLTYGENIDEYEKKTHVIYQDSNELSDSCSLRLYDNSYSSTLVFDISIEKNKTIGSFRYYLTPRYLKKYNILVDDEKVNNAIEEYISNAFKEADIKELRYKIEKTGIMVADNGDVYLTVGFYFYKDGSDEIDKDYELFPMVVIIGSVK